MQLYIYSKLVKVLSDPYVSSSLIAIRIKKPIKTKFRLPVFNWTALKPNQINGTVFNEIDDERVLEVILSVNRILSMCSMKLSTHPKCFCSVV